MDDKQLNEYKDEVKALPRVEIHDVRIFLRNAARLASMGHPSILNEWQEEVNEQAKNDIVQHLKERRSIGIEHLDISDDTELAHCIIEAYDMSCLMHLDKESENPLFQSIYDDIEDWIDHAEDAFDTLTDAAADLLNDFLITFPINESHTLMRVPFGEFERTFIRWIEADAYYVAGRAKGQALDKNLQADRMRRCWDMSMRDLYSGDAEELLRTHFATAGYQVTCPTCKGKSEPPEDVCKNCGGAGTIAPNVIGPVTSQADEVQQYSGWAM